MTFRHITGCLCAVVMVLNTWGAEESAFNVKTITVKSTIDETEQPCLFVKAKGNEPRPLLVFLHTWSNGYDLDTGEWRDEAARYNWHFLQPHFRGPNNNPEACASPLARQDILDALDYVLEHYAVDKHRVYLAGASGGGHMTLVMAAHAPDRWAAASAWCAITDLAAWHKESTEAGRKYANDIELCVGGRPGDSEEVDAQLRYRSPIYHLQNAKGLPLEIATGIHDGHTGSVPVHHTLDAFNVMAKLYNEKPVTDEEIARLSREEPLPTEEEQDKTFGRAIHLRRYAGPCRVTIFEGTHEGLPKASLAFLARYARK
ncbi:MAG: prolyl oligopeptidase family serine peptidase [Candidatus Hydrogenedentota bacterium]